MGKTGTAVKSPLEDLITKIESLRDTVGQFDEKIGMVKDFVRTAENVCDEISGMIEGDKGLTAQVVESNRKSEECFEEAIREILDSEPDHRLRRILENFYMALRRNRSSPRALTLDDLRLITILP